MFWCMFFKLTNAMPMFICKTTQGKVIHTTFASRQRKNIETHIVQIKINISYSYTHAPTLQNAYSKHTQARNKV